MVVKLGPYVFSGVIDCGYLVDKVARDVKAAKADSRETAMRLLENIKAAHADWLEGHNLKGKALRRAGTPFRAAYDDLERWLSQTAPPKKPRAKNGFVYVIGPEENATVVKIGFATNIKDRLATLQTSTHYTLKVIAVFKATIEKEKEIHRLFASDHIRGEWFNRSEAIDAFVATIKTSDAIAA